MMSWFFFFFFQAEDGIRDYKVTGVQTCALPISRARHGPVQGAEDRAPALPHREDEAAREAGEFEQSRLVAPEQRSDDVLDVAARAERPPGSRDDDRAHAGLVIERAERVAQLDDETGVRAVIITG